jgi:hypothetical protein
MEVPEVQACLRAREHTRDMSEQRILDPCCGTRMMWFDPANPDAPTTRASVHARAMTTQHMNALTPEITYNCAHGRKPLRLLDYSLDGFPSIIC